MKKLLPVLIATIVLTSCHFTSGSGRIKSENRTVDNFTAISVGNSFDVEVKIGPVVSVRVEADDNIIKHIETSVSDETLKIYLEDNFSFTDAHLKVYITTPQITAISTSGSASVVVQDVISSKNKLKFKASSSSDIKAQIDAPEVEADASSSATIDLKGKTKTYHAQASSSSDINSWNLLSENATAEATSSATIKLHASVSLDAKANSSADIIYHGAAKVNKTESSSGSVEKKD